MSDEVMTYRDSLLARQLLVDEFIGAPTREHNALKKQHENEAAKRARRKSR